MKPTFQLRVNRRSHKAALLGMKELGLWDGSFNGRESTLQQLSPYIGKLKSGIVRALIEYFTRPGHWVCDPFSGSGVVLLEALLAGRKAAVNDLSIYAYCVTKGKAEAPTSCEEAIRRTEKMLRYVARHWKYQDLRRIDRWVRDFFHPKTLKEILAAFEYCRRRKERFLAACLCGILHHQRPGFLSYPASHMVPYLRPLLFPQKRYPELYSYRPLADRIRKKIKRVYRRSQIEQAWTQADYDVRMNDARTLPFQEASMDFILTSPPYYGALDYARDNRLRLWFLGERNWRHLDRRLTAKDRIYEEHMEHCLREMHRILKPGRYCVLIVGEVQRNGKTRDTATVLARLAHKATGNGLALDCTVEDEIPDIRRSRRGTRTTKMEKILVFKRNC